jgi:hypothetical protein
MGGMERAREFDEHITPSKVPVIPAQTRPQHLGDRQHRHGPSLVSRWLWGRSPSERSAQRGAWTNPASSAKAKQHGAPRRGTRAFHLNLNGGVAIVVGFPTSLGFLPHLIATMGIVAFQNGNGKDVRPVDWGFPNRLWVGEGFLALVLSAVRFVCPR